MKLTVALARLAAGLTVVLCLAGCGKGGIAANMSADPAVVALAEQAYTRLVSADDRTLVESFSEDMRSQNPERLLPAMRLMLPDGQSQPGKLVGWRKFVGTGGRQAEITERYDYPAGSINANVVFGAKGDAAWQIIGFHVGPSSTQDKAAPVFSTSKGPPPPVVVRDKPAGAAKKAG